MTEQGLDAAREAILIAAAENVIFDGWTEENLNAAAAEAGVEPSIAKLLFPRGGLDLALGYHKRGDRLMAERLDAEDLSSLRFRDKVARALEIRLEVTDREAVRRGATLFALPMNTAEGAQAVWDTADAVWMALGDQSNDINWYSKRATLSTIWSSIILYWLADESEDMADTRDFISRRIDNVMQFEKAKSAFNKSPFGKLFSMGPGRLLDRIRAPRHVDGFPGSVKQD